MFIHCQSSKPPYIDINSINVYSIDIYIYIQIPGSINLYRGFPENVAPDMAVLAPQPGCAPKLASNWRPNGSSAGTPNHLAVMMLKQQTKQKYMNTLCL